MSSTEGLPELQQISVQMRGRVGHLTLGPANKLNPLGPSTLREIALAARWFDTQNDVRVVIVSGAGRVFSAGADVAGFVAGNGQLSRADADAGRDMAEALEDMRAVAIAAIHGWCIGGALVLAAACDLRVAATGTRFSVPEVDLGIPLAWGGIPRLVREIGPALTKELVMTCRVFDADEAKAAGFLNRVVPAEQLDQCVRELADAIAAKPAMAIAATKHHVNAVTAQAMGSQRGFSDADGLLAAFADPECEAARQNYLAKRSSGRK